MTVHNSVAVAAAENSSGQREEVRTQRSITVIRTARSAIEVRTVVGRKHIVRGSVVFIAEVRRVVGSSTVEWMTAVRNASTVRPTLGAGL